MYRRFGQYHRVATLFTLHLIVLKSIYNSNMSKLTIRAIPLQMNVLTDEATLILENLLLKKIS